MNLLWQVQYPSSPESLASVSITWLNTLEIILWWFILGYMTHIFTNLYRKFFRAKVLCSLEGLTLLYILFMVAIYYTSGELSAHMALVVKNPPANEGDLTDSDSILGWGRSPGRGNGNPLIFSENPMDRGPWQATIHGVAKSQTRQHLSAHTQMPHNPQQMITFKRKDYCNTLPSITYNLWFLDIWNFFEIT